MAVLIYLQQAAFRRFRNGSAGPWGAIAAGLFGFRMLVKYSKRKEEVAYRGVIKPGETITVSHLTETRRELQASTKRAKRRGRRGADVVTADA